jgi:hypothetical protein
MQVVCGPQCGVLHGRRKLIATQRVNLKARREALLTLGDHHAATQAIFNKYIRLRDANQPCISCGTYSGQRHAGHYRPVGSTYGSALRYNELNVNVQDAQCNTYLSGNLTNYRIGLVAKIGAEAVEWLEGPHDLKQYRVEDLKEIQQTYKRKIKELEQCTQTS